MRTLLSVSAHGKQSPVGAASISLRCLLPQHLPHLNTDTRAHAHFLPFLALGSASVNLCTTIVQTGTSLMGLDAAEACRAAAQGNSTVDAAQGKCAATMGNPLSISIYASPCAACSAPHADASLSSAESPQTEYGLTLLHR